MATIVDAIVAHAPERIALRDQRGTASYGDLDAKSAALATELRAVHGVVPGDRVAMLFEPGLDFVAALVAIWRARAVALVLTPLHPAKERAALVEDARAKLVLASTLHQELARASAPDVTVAVIDATSAWPKAETLDAELRPHADDLALQMYTSGTTGRPKGVLLRHHQLAAQLDSLARAWRMRADDVLVHALPLHHIHGLAIAMLNVLRVGGTVHLLPAFDANAVLAACEGATVFMGVPTMYARLLDALDALDENARHHAASTLRALRLCVSGSAALPVSIGNRWASYAGTYPLERFGMTELGVALSNPLDGERVPGSVGSPLDGVLVRVIDDEGRDAREGQLLVGGPTVFDGYFERPDADAESFVVHEGIRWFKTGDTVRLDTHDRTQILGRTSVDILKSAGYKLSAIEIEEALRRHPAVRDAAVVGLPDETYGQRVAAAVMLHANSTASVDDLTAFLREELAPYKLPRVWRIVDDVPRNALGKVLKPALAQLLAIDRP
jgi:malonyl-CoA/methylmalonyl-CoA synthetase